MTATLIGKSAALLKDLVAVTTNSSTSKVSVVSVVACAIRSPKGNKRIKNVVRSVSRFIVLGFKKLESSF